MNGMKPKFLVPLGMVAAALVLFAPGAGRTLAPLLLVAACPLSMLFMMRRMSNTSANGSCSEDNEIAKLREEVASLKQTRAVDVSGHSSSAAPDR